MIPLGSIVALATAAVAGGLAIHLYARRRREELIRRRLGLEREDQPQIETGEGFEWRDLPAAAFMALGLHRIGEYFSPRLSKAGIHHPLAGAYYFLLKALLVAVAVAALFHFVDLHVSGLRRAAAGLLVAACVWLGPDLVVGAIGRERRRRIQIALPLWLDLHSTLVEGGMGFDAALARIVEETQDSDHPLFLELRRLHSELTLGEGRIQAYRHMAERVRVDEIEQVVAALVQAERLGAGIVDSLRAQADMIRNQVAEARRESAEKLPVKLIFPMIFGILPSLFVVIVLPGVLRLISLFNVGVPQ